MAQDKGSKYKPAPKKVSLPQVRHTQDVLVGDETYLGGFTYRDATGRPSEGTSAGFYREYVGAAARAAPTPDRRWAEYVARQQLGQAGVTTKPMYTAKGATFQSIYTMSAADRINVKDRMREAGLLKGSQNSFADEKTAASWTNLLTFANQQGLTWEAALVAYMGQGYAQERAAAGGGGGGGGRQSLAGSYTTTDVDVSLTGKDEALKLLNMAAQALLGRDARQPDIDTFLSRLNAAQQASPTTTTTTTTTNERGQVVNRASNRKETDVVPGVQAESEVKTVDENEMKAYRRAGYTQVIERLMSGR